MRLALEVPLFSIWASAQARRLRADHDIVLSHGDSFTGDAFVAHSCHRAAIAAKRAAGGWGWLVNPLHWFVLSRESYNFGRARKPWLVAVSRGVAQEYERFYGIPPGRIVCIPNGVDRERYRPAGDKGALRRELGLPQGERLALFAGHEFARKGLREAIEGVALCRPDARPSLLVAGGDRPDRYRALAHSAGIEERVRFLGPRADLPRLYAACDLFLFLSNYESFGLVGLEALSAGLPVITTRVSGVVDYIREEENGLFVERNGAAVARALERLATDGALFERLRGNARASSEAYDWQLVAARYLTAMERMLAEDV